MSPSNTAMMPPVEVPQIISNISKGCVEWKNRHLEGVLIGYVEMIASF